MPKHKKKNKFKKWWKNHWDEVMLIGSLLLSAYFYLRFLGVV